MKYDFSRRPCEFGIFNNRRETHGDEKVKAIDLPMRFQVKPRELDMLSPTQGIKLSEFMYGKNLRKPQLQTHLLSPLYIYRHPEHISLTIYDDGIDKRKFLKFDDVSIKGPYLEFDADGVCFLVCKAQIHPDEKLDRIGRNVECQTREFECTATQPELFDQEEDDDEASPEQTEMPTGVPTTEGAGGTGDDDDDED